MLENFWNAKSRLQHIKYSSPNLDVAKRTTLRAAARERAWTVPLCKCRIPSAPSGQKLEFSAV